MTFKVLIKIYIKTQKQKKKNWSLIKYEIITNRFIIYHINIHSYNSQPSAEFNSLGL
jgi:hypothetical protein